MNELVSMVSMDATDPQIEGEIMPLLNVSGLSEKQLDNSLADLEYNKTTRKKNINWKKITQQYKNAKKVCCDTSKYEIMTDI